MRNAAGSSFRIEYFYFSYLLVLFDVMMYYVCHQHGMGIKPDDISAFRFLFKVSYICNNVQTVFSGVRAQCALCLSLWCEMDVIRSKFFYAGMLRNAVPVMADAVKDRRVGWFLSSFCP